MYNHYSIFKRPQIGFGMVYFCLLRLYAADKILSDRSLQRFSVDPKNQYKDDSPTDFELFSDRVGRKYANYIYDCSKVQYILTENSPTISYGSLREILLSKDLSLGEQLPATDADFFLFLDGKTELSGEKACLVSYPRSGNSFIRNYVMRASGLYTGSDIPSVALHNSGFLGDHTTSDSNNVWVTKTHYPINQITEPPKFSTNKIFLIVRNPLDSIYSQANLS